MCWRSSRFALLLLRPGHSDSDTRTKDSRTQDTRRKDDTETKRLHPQRRSGEQRKFQFWDSMKVYWQRQKCKTICCKWLWNCVLQLTLGWRLSALMMKKTKATEQLSALKTNDTAADTNSRGQRHRGSNLKERNSKWPENTSTWLLTSFSLQTGQNHFSGRIPGELPDLWSSRRS